MLCQMKAFLKPFVFKIQKTKGKKLKVKEVNTSQSRVKGEVPEVRMQKKSVIKMFNRSGKC